MDLDTAGLRALAAVAEELHFGRAAARLGVTQQAVSKRIRRLEEQLGVDLVNRSDRRAIRLTGAGRQVLAVAQEVLAGVDRLAPLLGRDEGRLRIDVVGDCLAPAAWVRRAVLATGLPVDVVERPPAATAEQLLLEHRAAAAFGRAGAVPEPWPEGIRRRLVLLEPMALLVPHDHPWAREEALPLAALAGRRIWFPMASAPVEWRGLVAELAARTGVEVFTTGSTFGYRQWAEDVTAGLVPPSLIGEAMRPPTPSVRIVPLVDPTPVFPWWLLWGAALSETDLTTLLGGMGFAAEARRGAADVWMPAADAVLLREG